MLAKRFEISGSIEFVMETFSIENGTLCNIYRQIVELPFIKYWTVPFILGNHFVVRHVIVVISWSSDLKLKLWMEFISYIHWSFPNVFSVNECYVFLQVVKSKLKFII